MQKMGKARNRRGILIMVVGILVAAGIAAVAIVLSRPATVPTAAVVVALKDIPGGSAITVDEVAVQQMAIDSVPAGAFSDPTQVTGKYAVLMIPAKAIVVPSGVVADTSQITIGAPGSLPLKAGNVAISLPYAGDMGAGGYVKAGDHVDILVDVTGTGHVKYAFQDVPVLRAGSSGQQGGAAGSLLVVEVPRGEAKTMMSLLEEQSGTSGAKAAVTPHIVGYVLRPTTQGGKGYLPSTPYTTAPQEQSIGPNDLAQLFGQ